MVSWPPAAIREPAAFLVNPLHWGLLEAVLCACILWYIRLMCPCCLALPRRMQNWQQSDYRPSNRCQWAKIQVSSQLGVPKAKGLVQEGRVDGGDSGLWRLLHGWCVQPSDQSSRGSQAPRVPHGLVNPLSPSQGSCSLKSAVNRGWAQG